MYHNFADTAMPPTLTDLMVMGTNVRISWDHTDKGPCFSNLTFSYNITWYPVVGGVPQRREGQRGVTKPGATEYIITNLLSNTDYRVELVGFTPSDLAMQQYVHSEVAMVNFTTEGVCPYACDMQSLVWFGWDRGCAEDVGQYPD